MNFKDSEFFLLVVAFLVGYFFQTIMKGCNVVEGQVDGDYCNKCPMKDYKCEVVPDTGGMVLMYTPTEGTYGQQISGEVVTNTGGTELSYTPPGSSTPTTERCDNSM